MSETINFDPRVQLDPLVEIDDSYYGYIATDGYGLRYYTSDYTAAIRWVNS